MTADRRTVLTMLGLAGAGAVGTETFMSPPAKAGGAQSVNAAYDKERFARAFENIAKSIRNGQIEVDSLGIISDLRSNSIADMHELKFSFRHCPEV